MPLWFSFYSPLVLHFPVLSPGFASIWLVSVVQQDPSSDAWRFHATAHMSQRPDGYPRSQSQHGCAAFTDSADLQRGTKYRETCLNPLRTSEPHNPGGL